MPGGEPLVGGGMPWRPHTLLMVVSAKLLADTENMLQVCEAVLSFIVLLVCCCVTLCGTLACSRFGLVL